MKNTLLIILLFACSTICKAQNTSYFSFDFNGYTIEKMIKVSGNNYVGVLYYSQGYCLTKFDNLFNVIWSKHITQRDMNHILDLDETNNGNYLLLGDVADSSFLFKFSTHGNLLNVRYFTSAALNNFTPTNIARSINGDGALVAGGYCNTPNYLIRLDDNLNVVWKYQYIDGTGSCAQSRSGDIITESNKYTTCFNPSSGGIDLVSIDDNGTILSAHNFTMSLQAAAFPTNLIKLSSGDYVASWESIIASNGTEYIFMNAARSKGISRKYNLATWYGLIDYMEYDTDQVVIGGTYQTGGSQSNVFFGVDKTGNLLWS